MDFAIEDLRIVDGKVTDLNPPTLDVNDDGGARADARRQRLGERCGG